MSSAEGVSEVIRRVSTRHVQNRQPETEIHPPRLKQPLGDHHVKDLSRLDAPAFEVDKFRTRPLGEFRQLVDVDLQRRAALVSARD